MAGIPKLSRIVLYKPSSYWGNHPFMATPHSSQILWGISSLTAHGPTGSDLAADKAGWTIARKLLHVVWTVWTTIWLFNSLPWQITIFKFGKQSISMGHLYHGYVSHNQRVQKFMRKRKQSKHLVQDLALCPAPTPASARMKHRGVIPAMFPNEVGWIRILLADFRYFRCPTQICV